MILALAGGVGGAKLADGLAQISSQDELLIAVNTGDDFVHLGLHISPDLDTVMYTLAGLANPETGWGRVSETRTFMAALDRLGGETWFQLGDGDLATHVERTRRLAAGESLSGVTDRLRQALGVACPVLPMSDNPVRTMVDTDEGRLAFQHYFVRRRCEPVVKAIVYEGAAEALPEPRLLAAMMDDATTGIILCPSNPYLSIGPFIAMPAFANALRRRTCPALAVSPIIAGSAVKGPAAKIMRELGVGASALSVARHYRGLIDALLIDHQDAHLASDIRALSIEPIVTDIMMRSVDDRKRLACECRQAVERLQGRR